MPTEELLLRGVPVAVAIVAAVYLILGIRMMKRQVIVIKKDMLWFYLLLFLPFIVSVVIEISTERFNFGEHYWCDLRMILWFILMCLFFFYAVHRSAGNWTVFNMKESVLYEGIFDVLRKRNIAFEVEKKRNRSPLLFFPPSIITGNLTLPSLNSEITVSYRSAINTAHLRFVSKSNCEFDKSLANDVIHNLMVGKATEYPSGGLFHIIFGTAMLLMAVGMILNSNRFDAGMGAVGLLVIIWLILTKPTSTDAD